jgi:hypothetical protein
MKIKEMTNPMIVLIFCFYGAEKEWQVLYIYIYLTGGDLSLHDHS